MVSKNTIVKNPSGLHMRPASVLSQIATGLSSDIILISGDEKIQPKSILSLMSCQIQKGTEVTIVCTGENEVEDLDTIINAIDSGLGEL